MSRTLGRQPEGPRISVRVDPALLMQIDAEATRSGQSRASTIRQLLERAVDDTGVDVAQIRRNLALSPADRICAVGRSEQRLAGLRGRAAR